MNVLASDEFAGVATRNGRCPPPPLVQFGSPGRRLGHACGSGRHAHDDRAMPCRPVNSTESSIRSRGRLMPGSNHVRMYMASFAGRENLAEGGLWPSRTRSAIQPQRRPSRDALSTFQLNRVFNKITRDSAGAGRAKALHPKRLYWSFADIHV